MSLGSEELASPFRLNSGATFLIFIFQFCAIYFVGNHFWWPVMVRYACAFPSVEDVYDLTSNNLVRSSYFVLRQLFIPIDNCLDWLHPLI